MGIVRGRVSEVRMELNGGVLARLRCPPGVVPEPGQYLLARNIDNPFQALPLPLFQQSLAPDGFWAAPSLPVAWGPGTELELRGPLGKGFQIPSAVHRIGLIAMGETSARLLSLLGVASAQDCAVALYSDQPLPLLPSFIEAFPLSSAPEAVAWADFLAIDLPLAALSQLRQVLDIPSGMPLPCPAQILVMTPLPCGGIAGCGVCAVPARRGWMLACEDGPVFSLQDLEW